MFADTIQLDCPSCSEPLEIDSGFAGGVCRCSACGTLMTVPADPRQERAERLERPDRPGAPAGGAPSPRVSGQADEPDGAVAIEADETPASPVRPSRPGAPGRATQPAPQRQPARRATAETAGEETYVTASGKTVRVSKKAAVPTARKRRKQLIRAGVVVTFFSVVGGVLLVMVLAIKLLVSDDGGTVVPVVGEGIGYETTINPFASKQLHILGLVPSLSTAVVVDASAESKRWWDTLRDALARGLEHGDSGSRMQLVFATARGAVAQPGDGVEPLTDANKQAMLKLVESVSPAGKAAPKAGVAKALAGVPDHVIYITGRELASADVEGIRAALRKQPVLQFDIVVLDARAPAATEITESYNGRYLSIPTGQLEAWMDVAE